MAGQRMADWSESGGFGSDDRVRPANVTDLGQQVGTVSLVLRYFSAAADVDPAIVGHLAAQIAFDEVAFYVARVRSDDVVAVRLRVGEHASTDLSPIDARCCRRDRDRHT